MPRLNWTASYLASTAHLPAAEVALQMGCTVRKVHAARGYYATPAASPYAVARPRDPNRPASTRVTRAAPKTAAPKPANPRPHPRPKVVKVAKGVVRRAERAEEVQFRISRDAKPRPVVLVVALSRALRHPEWYPEIPAATLDRYR